MFERETIDWRLVGIREYKSSPNSLQISIEAKKMISTLIHPDLDAAYRRFRAHRRGLASYRSSLTP
jgi:hypothetical protein